MKVQISKWGNSLGVRLPKAAVEALTLAPGQTLELEIENGKVSLSRPRPRVRLEDLVAEMKRLGPENEPPLEDWSILPSEWPDEDWSDVAPRDDEQK